MVTLFGLLNIGARGIFASQAGLNTTGNNISNANTEGYSRQRVIQRSVDPITLPSGAFGQGVDIQGVERIRNMVIEGQVREAKSDMFFNQELDTILYQVQSILNDPLTPINDTVELNSVGGISNTLSRFFEAFHELSNSPEASDIRATAIERAQTLAETLANADRQLRELRDSLNQRVQFFVDEINRITSELSVLNRKIITTEAGSNVNANEFKDTRDRLLSQLAEIVPIQVVNDENGMVNVSIGGQWIVVNITPNVVLAEVVEEADFNKVSIRLGKHGLTTVDDVIRGGKLGAVLEARDRLVPQLETDIDTLARTVIFEVNKIQSASSGIEGYRSVQSNLPLIPGATKPDTLVNLDRLFNNPLTAIRTSQLSLKPYPIQNGVLSIRVGDENNDTLDTFDVEVNTGDTLFDLIQRIDRSDGVVQTARSTLTFDPVFVKQAQATQGADAAELAGPISALALAASTPISETPGAYAFDVLVRDRSGGLVDSNPLTPVFEPFTITINDAMTLADVANAIQTAGGGRLRSLLVPDPNDPTKTVLRIESAFTGETISIQNDTSGLIQAFQFPMTDPTLPLIGGDTTFAQTIFTGLATDSLFGAGSPAFSTPFSGPPPNVLQPGTFEFVLIDNRNVPIVNTISLDTAGIDTLAELETALEAIDPNISVTITADNKFQIQSSNHRSFFFQNDTTGLIKAMGFSEFDGHGELFGQPFQTGSFEIVVANEKGIVTHVVEVPVQADPSVPGGVLTLQGIIDRINASANGAGAPVVASIVSDPRDPNRNQIQIQAANGFEFTFRSDDSLLLSALGFTDGPLLQATRDDPILGAESTVGIGDRIGGLVRARILNEESFEISTGSGQQLSFVGDTSHFLAASGINALFRGTDARTIRVNDDLLNNAKLLGVSSDGSIGDNRSALAIAELEDRKVFRGMSIPELYRTQIAGLASEGSHVKQFLKTSEQILRELEILQEQEAGVSLDEESINLIKYQQAFQAAARYISTLDQLMDVVINQIGS